MPDKKTKPEPLTIEAVRKIATITIRKPDNAEMADVKVTCAECFCHGQRHPRGEVFPMEISLVPPHVAGGQVEVVAAKASKTG